MTKLNPQKTALGVGMFAATIKVIWSILVALGWAGPFLNWVLQIHFINETKTIAAFDIVTAITMIVVTFIVGGLFGFLFANVWNRVAQ